MSIKNVFGFNMNEDEIDGVKCIIRKIDENTQQEQDRVSEELDEYDKISKLPGWLRIVQIILMILGCIFVCSYVNALIEEDVGFVKAWANGGIFVILGAVFLIIAGILYFLSKRRANIVVSSEEFKETAKKAEKVYDESLIKLSVPENVHKVDVFSFPYKYKNGKIKQAGTFSTYVNTEMMLFKEDDMLCLADSSCVVGIPIDKIRSIVEIQKKVTTMGWNKETLFNKGEYKQYKLRSNEYGTIFVKTHYSLKFTSYGEEYEILIPCYDIEPFCKLTGIEVKQEQLD